MRKNIILEILQKKLKKNIKYKKWNRFTEQQLLIQREKVIRKKQEQI